MSDELGWSRFERRRQIDAAVAYFETMGLVPGDVVTDKESIEKREKEKREVISGVLRELKPRGWIENVERGVANVFAGAWSLLNAKEAAGVGTIVGAGEHVGPFKKAYGRASFGAGEVVALRNAFLKRADVDDEQPCVGVKGLVEIMHEVPGYEGVKDKDLKYVLEENGMVAKNTVDFDEFLEVSATIV